MPITPAAASAGSVKGAVVPIAYYNNAGSAFGNYTFSNIPQTFQDLMVVIYGRDASTGTSPWMSQLNYRFNGDAGTNYSQTRLYGSGSSAVSDRVTSQTSTNTDPLVFSGAGANIFSTTVTHILNYTNASIYKTFISRTSADANGTGWAVITAGLWRNASSGITSLSVYGGVGGFTAGSSIELFGIRSIGQ